MVRNLNERWAFYLSHITSYFCLTNQVLVGISLENFNPSILANFVLLCSQLWIVHNLCKTEAFWLSHITSYFSLTNQELFNVALDNFNSTIVANFIPLRSWLWIVYNLQKRSVLVSYLTSIFSVKAQMFVGIGLGNFSSPTLANFVLLRSRSWIVHNLRKRAV